jgi:hypothetical protein
MENTGRLLKRKSQDDLERKRVIGNDWRPVQLGFKTITNRESSVE